LPLTAIGALVSLVSVCTKAPPSTANGELVSEVTWANASICAVSSDIVVDGGGVVGGGVVLPEPPLSWWHAATKPVAAQITPRIRSFDFMI
jgi:hypothetical protein